jgi:RHS repeat-associated protein
MVIIKDELGKVMIPSDTIENIYYSFGNIINLSGDTGSYENELYFYHGDHLSSTQMITDINAGIKQQVLYAPFGEVITEYNAYWNNDDKIPDYLFNAKELDEESGMYYYEARYYNPPSFISRDPLFEKKPWMSAYAYCRNSPLNFVDPTGEDEYELNKQGEVKFIKKSDVHTLFTVDRKGNRTGQSLTLKDNTIFESLTKGKQDVVRRDAEGTITDKGTLRTATSNNKTDIAKTFMFMAENTNVEWSLYSSSENGKSSYGLGTYQFDDLAPSSSDVGLKGKITSMIHSHPNLENSVRAEKESMWGDQSVARNVSYNYYMFAPKSGNLYQVGNQNGNIIPKGRVSNFQQLMIYMK